MGCCTYNADTRGRGGTMQRFPAIWGCTGQPRNRDFQQEVKWKWKGEKTKGNWCSRQGSAVVFCFGFSFPGMCVCSTIAQMILLEEYKLLVFIAYSCFTALLEWQEHLCNLVWWMSQEQCSALTFWGRVPAVALDSEAIIIWLILFIYLNDWRIAVFYH